MQIASTKEEKLTIHNTKRRRANSFFFPSLPLRQDDAGTERKAAREKTKPTVDKTVAVAFRRSFKQTTSLCFRPKVAQEQELVETGAGRVCPF
jgi:hypothetical protein